MHHEACKHFGDGATAPTHWPSRARPRVLSQRRRGFTIVEVMMAAAVMVFGIASSLITLQFGMRSVDTARNMTLASQIMQSEVEILRLQNWAQIVALQTAQTTSTTPTLINPATTISTGTSTSLDATLTAIAARFTCTRLISDISGRANIKQITLNVSWTGVDGRPHQLSFETRYAKNGLSDYFYVSH
jgi:type II secretory pathway pseudopilin PulG